MRPGRGLHDIMLGRRAGSPMTKPIRPRGGRVPTGHPDVTVIVEFAVCPLALHSRIRSAHFDSVPLNDRRLRASAEDAEERASYRAYPLPARTATWSSFSGPRPHDRVPCRSEDTQFHALLVLVPLLSVPLLPQSSVAPVMDEVLSSPGDVHVVLPNSVTQNFPKTQT
jgi:hypothetical protein